ncbi:MAG: ATP-binding protein [Planctomycetia bacterium]|nr:ATP-binding protein [Planctomycetia bacterium]
MPIKNPRFLLLKFLLMFLCLNGLFLTGWSAEKPISTEIRFQEDPPPESAALGQDQKEIHPFSQIVRQYPLFIFGIPSFLLLLLSVFLWILLVVHKREYLLGSVLHSLPIRYFIADSSGKLLQYNYGKEANPPICRTLDDIKDEDIRGLIKKLAADALESRKPEEAYYTDAGRLRLAVVSCLPKSLFHKPTVIGISRDVTELQKIQEKARRDEEARHKEILEELANWKAISSIAQIYRFRYNPETHAVTSGSKELPNVWPIKDGIAIPPSEWICKEDLDAWYRSYNEILSGKIKEGMFEFRVVQEGKTRYFRGFIRGADTPGGELTGILQEVTRYIENQQKREALLLMWKNVIDSLPVIFVIKNSEDNYRYLQANGNFTDLVGRNVSEIIGLEEKDFFPVSKDADQIRQDDMKVIRSGHRMDFVETIHDKDGILHQFQAVKLPSINEAGQHIIISMALDITEAQEASEVRRIISSAFESLFSSDDLAVDLQSILKAICEFVGFDSAYICSEDEASKSLRLFTAFSSENNQQLFDIDTFRAEHAAHFPQYRKGSAAGNHVFLIDFSDPDDQELAKDLVPSFFERAREFDLRGIHVNYVSVDGKTWGAVGFITRGRKIKDLSDNEKRLLNLTAHIVELAITRKRIQSKLESALLDALAAAKAKSFFLSSMSHEIRTPLNAVIGFTDLLKDTELDRDTQLEYLDAVSDASHALMTLLNDILDLSKLTSGKYEDHPVLTNIQDIVREMDAAFHPKAVQKNLKLNFLASGIPDLWLDQPRLRQILFNLIGNAVKFTAHGEVNVKISFEKTEKEFGNLTMIISDTGIGIDPDDKEKLFEPFIQLNRMRGTNSSGSGTGLGLVIVKKIVDQNNGTLSLQSEMGRGSEFTILLPNIKSNCPDLAEKMESVPEEKNEKSHFIPKVLIVDDSDLTLSILERMLARLEIPHAAVHSGKEALNLLVKEPFDIVLTDILMPEMKGDELALQIRAEPQFANIAIIAMSTENESVMYDKSLFDKVLLKPIISKDLYENIMGKPEQK